MKLFLIAVMALLSVSLNAAAKPVADRPLNVKPKLVLKSPHKNRHLINEPVSYQWELMNDGCFHLFSVSIQWISPSNQWIVYHEPMNYTNYVGNTVMCLDWPLFDTMC